MAAKREDVAAPDILAAFRPETCAPNDVEKLIDFRIARLDEDIAKHLSLAEELRMERKAWLQVTGGRSRNGNPNEEIAT